MMRRLISALAVVAVATSPALAVPKKKAARAEFDKGVEAYTKGDFAGAAEALGKSFSLEADVETLFAWAQTERKLDRCDKAIELYEKLLKMKLPEENKDAVRVQIEECRAILSTAKTPPLDPKPDPKPDAKPDTKPDSDATDVASDAKPDTVADATGSPPDDTRPPPPSEGSSPAWWKNPVGGALVGVGLVGVAVGTVFFIQGKNADADKDNATTYTQYESLASDAESKGRIGVIGLAAGGALILGGVIWYATHSGGTKREDVVSGWVAPDSSGLVVTGRW